MEPGLFTLTTLSIPDVERGVGLALVLQTPHGHTWLYDTATGYPDGDGWHRDSNSGRDQIAPFLHERGIEALDGVIISHAHYDHFGGLSWLVDKLPTGTLIDSGYRFDGERDDHYDAELADYERLRDDYRRRGAYRAALAGHTLDLDPALEVEVIAPPPGFFQPDQQIERADWNPAAHYMLNSNSLMLRIRYRDIVFLLPGDIEKEDQKRYLLGSVPPEKLACNVLIAPGHGLHTHPDFVAATRPQVTVVSLFERWLSSCSALEGFAVVGSEVYVTGRDGNVQVTSDGSSIEVTTECANA